MVVVHLHVDVCESMGANTVNTIAEGLAPHVVDLVGGRVGLKIVTNFCTERRASAMFRIPLSNLSYKKLKGPLSLLFPPLPSSSLLFPSSFSSDI